MLNQYPCNSQGAKNPKQFQAMWLIFGFCPAETRFAFAKSTSTVGSVLSYGALPQNSGQSAMAAENESFVALTPELNHIFIGIEEHI